MNSEIFAQIGLSPHQEKAYKYLLRYGASPPPRVAKHLKLSRTNSYKVLDSLVQLGLVARAEIDKKLVYRAEDPIVLASLVGEERNRVIALEKSVKNALKELRQDYQKTVVDNAVLTYKGAPAVKGLYEHQASLKKPIYFLQSRLDRAFMGFDAMHSIRFLANPHNTTRYGITPDVREAAVNPELDRKSNLVRTWMPAEGYTAPVEWTVSGDELMIITFGDKPAGIRIKDAVVADAFSQVWSLLNENLRNNPEYKKLPKKAARKI